jgi:hypothetical protein
VLIGLRPLRHPTRAFFRQPHDRCHIFHGLLATLARATTKERRTDNLAVWLEISLVPKVLFISLHLVIVSVRDFGEQRACHRWTEGCRNTSLALVVRHQEPAGVLLWSARPLPQAPRGRRRGCHPQTEVLLPPLWKQIADRQPQRRGLPWGMRTMTATTPRTTPSTNRSRVETRKSSCPALASISAKRSA